MRHLRGYHLRAIAGIAALLALAACSTADYGKPVNDFAAATGNADKALTDLNAEITEAYKGVLDDSLQDGSAFLQPVENDCLISSKRCRLEVKSFDTGETEPYPPAPPLTKMSELMAQISLYATNLKALVEANTAAKVSENVNAALGSVQNLAETVGKAGDKKTTVPQFATPVGAAVNWLIGQYIEVVKYEGLKHATAAAKDPIHKAAGLFKDVSVFISTVPRVRLAKEVRTARDAFRSNPSAANLAKFADAAARYDALLTAAPTGVFERMGAAHDALADSLQGGEVTFSDAVGKIEAFAAEAQKLAKILKDIRAIVPDDKKG